MKYSDFEIKGRLGKGAMATVWLAENKSLQADNISNDSPINITSKKTLSKNDTEENILKIKNKEEYAIKIIYINNQEIEESFKLALNIDHPNLMKAYSFFYDALVVGDLKTSIKLVTVLEYIKGVDLFEFTNRMKNGLKDFDIYCSQIFKGIEYLHNNNFIHRDIKAQNIMVTENLSQNDKYGTVKILDYDFLCKKSNEFIVKKVGTPYYFSPEICKGFSYDEKVDIWALGVTLYYCICRKYPFSANGNNSDMDRVDKRDKEVLMPLLEKNIINLDFNRKILNESQIEQKYKDLINLMLEKDPRKRIGISEVIENFK